MKFVWSLQKAETWKCHVLTQEKTLQITLKKRGRRIRNKEPFVSWNEATAIFSIERMRRASRTRKGKGREIETPVSFIGPRRVYPRKDEIDWKPLGDWRRQRRPRIAFPESDCQSTRRNTRRESLSLSSLAAAQVGSGSIIQSVHGNRVGLKAETGGSTQDLINCCNQSPHLSLTHTDRPRATQYLKLSYFLLSATVATLRGRHKEFSGMTSQISTWGKKTAGTSSEIFKSIVHFLI